MQMEDLIVAPSAPGRLRTVVRSGAVGYCCAAFLAAHLVGLVTLGGDAKAISYAFMIAAPLFAASVCFSRGLYGPFRQGWTEAALAMLLWAGGMATNMAIDLLSMSAGNTPGISMLLYVLFGVPIIFAVASPVHEKWHIRLVDGALALALGVLFFVHTFLFTTLVDVSEEGVGYIRWMFDVENGFIAVFASIRWRASVDLGRRAFFRSLALFAWSYFAVAAFTNHLLSDTEVGTAFDLLVDLPFLLLALMGARNVSAPGRNHRPPSQRFALAVRAGSPLMLPATILVVACALLERNPGFAIAGFVVATLGYGLRNVLAQMRGIAEQDRLDALSRIDALTGLPNRRQFNETLQREWSRSRRFQTSIAVLMIDIDHFKALNDGLGHLVGDERLRQVGQELAACATRAGDFVGRFGGEEFAVVLTGNTEEAAEAVADMMLKAVASRALPTPAPLGIVTISVGLAWRHRADMDDPASLVADADAALYQAEQQGRNPVPRHGRPSASPRRSERQVP